MDNTESGDLLTLARTASLPELIGALYEDATLDEESGPLPSRANQIARLIVSRAIRLIRLGTQSELADGGLELIQALSHPNVKVLADDFPEAHRLLSGAAVALRSATSPASSGGELAVLRGWNKKARRAVQAVINAKGEEISRAALREQLGVDESYLSHLLADLEAAGLVVRIRDGRTVTVHTGPAARSEHVQAFIERHDDDGDDDDENEISKGARTATQLFQAILDGKPTIAMPTPETEGIDDLRRQLGQLKHELKVTESEIASTTADERRAISKIQFSGTSLSGRHDGAHVDRWLVWVAQLDGDMVASVETWTSLKGMPGPATTGGETLPRAEQEQPELHREVSMPRLLPGYETIQVDVVENVELNPPALADVFELQPKYLFFSTRQELSFSLEDAHNSILARQRDRPRHDK